MSRFQSKILLHRVLSRPHHLLSLIQTARTLAKLEGHPHAAVRAAASACKSALLGRFSPEEQAWIAEVEDLRSRASRSAEVVRIDDFGAVSPNSNLTAEQMYAGRVIERTVGAACKAASKPLVWSSLLFQLVRHFDPKTCVELGCCVGISATFQAGALRLNGHGGRLWTLEGAPAFAEVARRHFQEVGVDVEVVVGRFQDTLAGFLTEHAPIDYAFIDGHHDEQATIDYFEQFLPHCGPGAVLVFDDINWSKGMTRAWHRIEADPRVPLAFDCGEIGLCVMDATLSERVRARVPLL
ncbi:MAG: class I SAM-dependent methyltransferase [Deltaproteobacteria bacterium]|nr:class I SAM-dependent methyltransferase [Deltaproteobacteria bacterium]